MFDIGHNMSKVLVTNFYDDLPLNILKSLKLDNPKAKESGACLNGLRCPACGKNEAFTYLDKPFSLICHRNNHCGINTPIKSVYPELWQDLAKRYPPTPKDKKATARAYLESRKLNTALFKFEQSTHQVNGKTYPTVKFTFAGLVQHRLIDYLGKDKNRTIGSYTGKVYEALIDVTKNQDNGLRVFITEGIIDALSWKQAGHSAIATLSSGHCPREYFEQYKGKHYVLGFDNDKAGHEAIAKHIALFSELSIDYSVFLPPIGKDANDLLASDLLNDDTIQRGLWRGKLHTAANPLEYFETYLEQYPITRKLIFAFHGESFKVFIKTDKNGDDITPPSVVKLADCSIKLLYSIVNDSVELAQKIHHVLELESKREGINRVKISASETTNLNPFKEVLQNHRQQFYGNGQDLAGLFDMLYKNKPPKIRELSIIGYDAKSGCYVFPQFMYQVKQKRLFW